jgi:ATP-dependent Clp protease protease subunit
MQPAIPLGDTADDYTDLMSYLLRNRIIFVGARIDDQLATQTVAQILALEAIDPTADIRLYINSAGGSPYAVVGMLDTIRAIQPQVSTVAMGNCSSTATVLLAAGAKGKRFAMPSTRIMMHQPAGGAMGSADEVNIQASELNRTMKVIHQFYVEFTGQSLEKVQEETDRDNFMSPQQAMDLGLIDGVIR